MYELFIALRYLRSKHKVNFITIISMLSTVGIMLGVAALVIVLSIFNGFGAVVQDILISFDPHVRITMTSGEASQRLPEIKEKLRAMEEIESWQPYAEGKAILLNDNNYEVLNLKGIGEGSESDWGVRSSIRRGEYDLSGDNKVIIGFPTMLKMSRNVGDTLLVTSFGSLEKTLLNYSLPVTRPFEVSGVFETNNKEYDNSYVFTSLENAKQILGLGDRISGLEIRLHDIGDSEKIQNEFQEFLGKEDFTVKTWYDLHRDLYNVMLLERWGAYIILALIIAVATFNILGSLTMSVIEKKKDIGVLRAMGVEDKSVLRIFMFEGLLIGIIGTVIGLAIGIFVVWLQQEYNFYPLDPRKYIMDSLPMEFRLSDIFAITGISLLLTFLASLYPAKRAMKMKVTDAIKWE